MRSALPKGARGIIAIDRCLASTLAANHPFVRIAQGVQKFSLAIFRKLLCKRIPRCQYDFTDISRLAD